MVYKVLQTDCQSPWFPSTLSFHINVTICLAWKQLASGKCSPRSQDCGRYAEKASVPWNFTGMNLQSTHLFDNYFATNLMCSKYPNFSAGILLPPDSLSIWREGRKPSPASKSLVLMLLVCGGTVGVWISFSRRPKSFFLISIIVSITIRRSYTASVKQAVTRGSGFGSGNEVLCLLRKAPVDPYT